MEHEIDLDDRIAALLTRLATSQRDAESVAFVMEFHHDPFDAVAATLRRGRQYMGPAMMPGYRRAGNTKAKRLRAPHK